MKTRYKELDSLRGLAALSVVSFHYLSTLPLFTSQNYWTDSFFVSLLKYTPLHIFWAGSEAVLFFFVLSGFVLSLQFFEKKRVSYSSFLIKRFFRIYIPAYCAIALAMILNLAISRHGIDGLSDWFNSIWVHPISFYTVLDHLLLIRYFGYGQILPVLWTLVMEIRISLIFPILIYFIKKFDWKINLAGGLLLSLGYYFLSNDGVRKEILMINMDYVSTLAYINMFIIGILIAKHRDFLILKAKKYSSRTKIFLLVGAILLYTIRYWLLGYFGMHNSGFIADTSATVGVAIFLVLSLSTKISNHLQKNIFYFIGKISYSVYLYHAIILLTLTYLLYEYLPIPIIWILCIIITFFISFLSYRFLEVPSIQMGRFFLKK